MASGIASPRTVVIGAGHNALTAAFYLAKAGRRPLVLEQADVVGGGAKTAEIAPGFLCPGLSHEEHLSARVARDMNLAAVGVEWLAERVDVCSLDANGPALVLHHDIALTARGLAARSTRDAAAWPRFTALANRVADALQPLLDAPPPDVANPSLGDMWSLLQRYLALRAMDRQDAYTLMRWLPMPVADLVDDWFEDDLLRATLAARGLLGTSHGPRAAGSGLVWLVRRAHERAARPAPARVRGGPGALTAAMSRAATAAGAEIRVGQRVERIVTERGGVAGVVVGGKTISVDCVVSGADPKTTFLRLVDADAVPEDFAHQLRHYRASGTMAKLNLALSSLPQFNGVTDERLLSGRIHIGPSLDYLEEANDAIKYGQPPERPWLEMRMPSLVDTSLAPKGSHVASVYIHSVPRTLTHGASATAREQLLATALRVLDDHAPGFSKTVVAAHLLTPEDIEHDCGVWGGHGFHGDVALDQWFVMRPAYGHARHATPIKGLYLCGAGTHPGGFLTGISGRLAAERVLRGRSR
jgi:phytoene dehydrogenase-like protein